jgi:hypothetical protein
MSTQSRFLKRTRAGLTVLIALMLTTTPRIASAQSAQSAPDVTGVQFLNWTEADGTRVMTGHVTYTLSGDNEGSVYFAFNDRNEGEAYYAINGEVVAHASYTETPGGFTGVVGPHVETWVAPNLQCSSELIGELTQESVGSVLLDGLVPQPFNCSEWGQKVMRGVKYLWIGVSTAVGAACCTASGGVACVVCAGAAAVAGAAGADAADGHCD